MTVVGENRSTGDKPVFCAILFSTKLKRTGLGMKPVRHIEIPATNRLNRGTALTFSSKISSCLVCTAQKTRSVFLKNNRYLMFFGGGGQNFSGAFETHRQNINTMCGQICSWPKCW
jgi:hypothetical protein